MTARLEFSTKASADGETALARQVRAQLRASSYPDIRRLESTFVDGALVVRGRVRSFYLKQVAWSLIASVGHFDRFDDRIEVVAVD